MSSEMTVSDATWCCEACARAARANVYDQSVLTGDTGVALTVQDEGE